jgi:hypothetical protein
MLGQKTKTLLYILATLLLWIPMPVAAQSSSSNNYRVDQTQFGTGSENDLESDNYKGQASVGDLGVGETSSLNYRAYAGFNTTDEPYLEFVVTGSNVDLEYLDVNQAKTANGSFYVRAWQADGYVVRTESDPPQSSVGGHQIAPLSSPSTSTPGAEQFGINLVANTSPTTFGAAPQQVPDNTFSFGEPALGYDTADNFKYVKSDIIAQSSRSTSVTIYTLSYIFNIDDETESGQYTFNHVLVATATY